MEGEKRALPTVWLGVLRMVWLGVLRMVWLGVLRMVWFGVLPMVWFASSLAVLPTALPLALAWRVKRDLQVTIRCVPDFVAVSRS
jgi:hypothetical protein